MEFTILSFFSALIWSTLFILMTYFIRKVVGMKVYYGVGLLTTLYSFCIFRLLFPIEFSYTKVIPFDKYYSYFYEYIYLNKYYNISILFIVVVFCSTVALYKIIKFTILYRHTIDSILRTSSNLGQHEINILENIKLNSSKFIKIELLENEFINTPCGIGLIKKKIILPKNNYTDDELYYILLHEYTHFLNRDIVVKIMSSIFCDVFWWNLPMQLLKKDLEQVLEIKCDLIVVNSMNDLNKAEYLSIILKTLKSSNNTQNEMLMGMALVSGKNKMDITERFEAVVNYKYDNKVRFIKYVSVAFTVLITVLSYSFIPQPYFHAPEEDESITLTENNTYILKNTEGKYFLYVNGVENGEISQETINIFVEGGIELREE